MNKASQLRYQTRPEINFHSYSKSPLKWTKQQSCDRLVTRLQPGNADREALPLVGAGGRASKTAFPGGTWERATWGVEPLNRFANSIINFHSYSESPLKWTKKESSVLLRGLLLLARDFNPWRAELLARNLKIREVRREKYGF